MKYNLVITKFQLITKLRGNGVLKRSSRVPLLAIEKENSGDQKIRREREKADQPAADPGRLR